MGASAMSDRIVYMRDADGLGLFRITITSHPDDTTGFSAVVHSITGWVVGDNEPYEVEPYLRCLIKWDSCSHFYFGETPDDGDGYIHMCGINSYRDHVALLKYLYELAFKTMGREPLDGEKWEDQ